MRQCVGQEDPNCSRGNPGPADGGKSHITYFGVGKIIRLCMPAREHLRRTLQDIALTGGLC